METRYTVRQAAEMVGVKSYVLRYWEDELELRISRNELGHRYYTGYDIQLFLNIKELKNRGLQLRAIKDVIPKIAQTVPGSTESKVKLLDGEKEASEGQEQKEDMTAEELRDELFAETEDEKILEFQQILERLITQELRLKNEEEARCRSLDAAIRRQQMARKEAAAAGEKKQKQRKRHKVHS
ncbi:MerR family transcriptional regulator [Blautia schinkii]|nr:MerR family transcriptional regulator [Blautia schinkii]